MRGQLDSGPRVGYHPRQAVWGGLEVPGGALAPARTSAEPQTCVAAGPISEGQEVTERTATRARTITTDGLRRGWLGILLAFILLLGMRDVTYRRRLGRRRVMRCGRGRW